MDYINNDISELAARMGSFVTIAEAERFAAILVGRGITTFSQIDEMSNEQFFGLIPAAIENK